MTGTPVGQSGFVCKSSLRNVFNLTPKWIEKLGAPDKTSPNPHYKCAAPMQLWAVQRVETFIDQHKGEAAFQKMQERRQRAQEVGREGVAKRLDELRNVLCEYVTNAEIEFDIDPNWGEQALQYRRQMDCPPDGPLDTREALNHLRHNCTNYHALLDGLDYEWQKKARQVVGVSDAHLATEYHEAYYRLKAKVNDALRPIATGGLQMAEGG